MAQLIEKDRAYAQAISTFRRDVIDIASTSAGVTALAHYNSGDEVGALAILDKLAASNDAARVKRDAVEGAAERRRIAMLAYQAQWRGKLSTIEVTLRFEAVVALDPNFSADWVVLYSLYFQANRLTDAMRAAREAVRLAQNDSERLAALKILATGLGLQGSADEKLRTLEEAVVVARRQAGINSSDPQAQSELSQSLESLGALLLAQGRTRSAALMIGEALQIGGRLLQSKFASWEYFYQMGDLVNTGAKLCAVLGQYAQARKLYEGWLPAQRRMLALQSDSGPIAIQFQIALLGYVDVLKLQGDLAQAHLLADEALFTARQQLKADPENLFKQLMVTGAVGSLAYIQNLQGEGDSALKSVDEAIAVFGPIAKKNSASLLLQAGLSDLLHTRAKIKLAQGNAVGAVSDLRLAEPAIQKLVESDNNNGEYLSEFVQLVTTYAEATAVMGNISDARENYTRALEVSRKMIAFNPANIEWQRNQWTVLVKFARLPGSEIKWMQIVELMEPFEAKGALSVEDKAMLENARKKKTDQK